MQSVQQLTSLVAAATDDLDLLSRTIRLLCDRRKAALERVVANCSVPGSGEAWHGIDEAEDLCTLVSKLSMVGLSVARSTASMITDHLSEVATSRESPPSDQAIEDSVQQSVDIMRGVEAALLAIDQQNALNIDNMREAALSRQAAPDVIAAFDQLIARLRSR